MRLRSYALVTALLSSPVAVAHADSFSFSFGTPSSPYSGSGTLTGSAIAGSQADRITGITGTVATSSNGSPFTITSILAPGTFPTPTNGGFFPANDNTVFILGGVGTLTQDGLSFVLTNGAQINLYNSASGGGAFVFLANGTTSTEAAAITIAPLVATPEPAGLALFGTGLLALTGALKRRFPSPARR